MWAPVLIAAIVRAAASAGVHYDVFDDGTLMIMFDPIPDGVVTRRIDVDVLDAPGLGGPIHVRHCSWMSGRGWQPIDLGMATMRSFTGPDDIPHCSIDPSRPAHWSYLISTRTTRLTMRHHGHSYSTRTIALPDDYSYLVMVVAPGVSPSFHFTNDITAFDRALNNTIEGDVEASAVFYNDGLMPVIPLVAVRPIGAPSKAPYLLVHDLATGAGYFLNGAGKIVYRLEEVPVAGGYEIRVRKRLARSVDDDNDDDDGRWSSADIIRVEAFDGRELIVGNPLGLSMRATMDGNLEVFSPDAGANPVMVMPGFRSGDIRRARVRNDPKLMLLLAVSLMKDHLVPSMSSNVATLHHFIRPRPEPQPQPEVHEQRPPVAWDEIRSQAAVVVQELTALRATMQSTMDETPLDRPFRQYEDVMNDITQLLDAFQAWAGTRSQASDLDTLAQAQAFQAQAMDVRSRAQNAIRMRSALDAFRRRHRR